MKRTGFVSRWALFTLRPFGTALGLFIVLNLVLAIKEPRLSASRVWLNIALREPWLSIFSSILGACLLAPHAWGCKASLRVGQGGVFCGFLALASANVVHFYRLILTGKIQSYAAFPFSLIVVLILSSEIARVLYWAPVGSSLPRPARRFFGLLAVLMASLIMVLAHIYTYGKTDYSTSRTADAVVVLGARVYPNGDLSDALRYRMDKAMTLFPGKVGYLILSGGVDANRLSEPKMMERYAIEYGNIPQDRTILDESGDNTYLSALNCAEIAAEHGFKSLLVVSQYFHNARIKLIFERAGTPCYTVPAGGDPLRREAFYLFREAIAYPYYLLFLR